MRYNKNLNPNNMGDYSMTYEEQLRIIYSYMIPPDVTMRLDCPFCNHKNTLSVTNDDNRMIWHCFHASCTARGTEKKRMSMATIKKIFNTEPVTPEDKFIIPEHFKTVYSNEKAMKYLQNNNCWESYVWRRVDIRYDVKQDRVVFLIKEFDNVRGAVGRALSKETYPKWFMYGNKNVPFKCGESNDAVLVEDCASACAVSNVLTGVALMGTSYNDSFDKHLKQYKKIFVALDRDATTKSFDIVNKLRYRGFANVQVKMLEDDLKYYDTQQIEKIFYDRKTNN